MHNLLACPDGLVIQGAGQVLAEPEWPQNDAILGFLVYVTCMHVVRLNFLGR